MPPKFGEIVVDMGLINQEKLDEILKMQETGREKLGLVMVNLNMFTYHQIEKVIERQNLPQGEGKRFGECAVDLGFISEEELEKAVRYQSVSQGMLGEIMVEMGLITAEQRDEALEKQKDC